MEPAAAAAAATAAAAEGWWARLGVAQVRVTACSCTPCGEPLLQLQANTVLISAPRPTRRCARRWSPGWRR